MNIRFGKRKRGRGREIWTLETWMRQKSQVSGRRDPRLRESKTRPQARNWNSVAAREQSCLPHRDSWWEGRTLKREREANSKLAIVKQLPVIGEKSSGPALSFPFFHYSFAFLQLFLFIFYFSIFIVFWEIVHTFSDTFSDRLGFVLKNSSFFSSEKKDFRFPFRIVVLFMIFVSLSPFFFQKKNLPNTTQEDLCLS